MNLMVVFIISFLAFWFAYLAYEAGTPVSKHPIVPEPWDIPNEGEENE